MPKQPLTALTHFLIDMDGTVYLGSRPVEGAGAFVAFLRATGRHYLFFTNNPSFDALHYSGKLGRMGISACPEDILTSGAATARYLAAATDYAKVFALGTPSFEAELRRAGLELTEDDPDAVVLAFDKTLTYAKLERACLLLREGLPYIATNPDKVCPMDYGYIPDCGAMAALIEAATGRTPQYIGKPNAEMIEMGMAKLDAPAETTAMVGDRLYTDMAMARRAGITSILVLSGETGRDEAADAREHPDYVFESVRTLHAALEAGRGGVR